MFQPNQLYACLYLNIKLLVWQLDLNITIVFNIIKQNTQVTGTHIGNWDDVDAHTQADHRLFRELWYYD